MLPFYLPPLWTKSVTYMPGTFCYILARFEPVSTARLKSCPDTKRA
jgi:hypothetical protein